MTGKEKEALMQIHKEDREEIYRLRKELSFYKELVECYQQIINVKALNKMEKLNEISTLKKMSEELQNDCMFQGVLENDR